MSKLGWQWKTVGLDPKQAKVCVIAQWIEGTVKRAYLLWVERRLASGDGLEHATAWFDDHHDTITSLLWGLSQRGEEVLPILADAIDESAKVFCERHGQGRDWLTRVLRLPLTPLPSLTGSILATP